MPTLTSGSHTIHYDVRPAAEPAATIFFLHGFGEHGGLYQRYAEALNTAGISLVSIDHRGHGRSDGKRGDVGSLDLLISDAERVYDEAVAGSGTPVVLQGHSLGAATAAVWAIRHPERQRGLVLSGAPLRPLEWFDEIRRTPGAEIDLDPEGLASEPEYLSWLANDPLAFTEADAVAAFEASLVPAWEEIERGIDDITVPVLFVHGAHDEVADAEQMTRMAERLPSAEVTIWEASRHDVLNDVEHEAVAARITAFVRELARS